MWVAGGKGTTNTMAYSYDGKNWIGLGNTIFNSGCEALYWTGSLWLAGGNSADSNTMAYSYDGINWIGLGRTIFTGACYGYAWNGTLYVAGGYGTNSLAYSYDGIQWTPITNHPFTVVDEVLWSGTLWVASGSAGVAYSYDGMNWAVGTSIGIRGQSVAYNGSMFVVIGGNSASWYSYDGILWIQGSIGFTSATSRGIVWTGTVWLAFSESTNNSPFSYNGINWIENRSSTFSTAINAGVMDGKLSDTIHLATDAYYQTGYKTLTISTVQSS
jgi:frataxin-like iron-binding protein CyaY